MIRALLVLGGFLLGGVLGFWVGYWLSNDVGRSEWIRRVGVFYDVMTILVAFAPYVCPCVGAVGGTVLLLRLTDRNQAPHDADRPPGSPPPGDLEIGTIVDAVKVKRGRVILLRLILAVLALDALVSGSFLNAMPDPLNSSRGQAELGTRAIRFLLTLLLLRSVYRGNRAAKWICVVLFGAMALVSLPVALVKPLLDVLILVNGSLVYALLSSSDVHAFLEAQPGRRR